MAIQFISKSSFTNPSTNSFISAPAGYQDGDLFLLFRESANQPITIPDGWTEIVNSPQSIGGAGLAGGIRLSICYKIVSGTQGSTPLVISGSHTPAQITCWRGVDITAPINITAGAIESSGSSVKSCPSITTTVDGCMVINVIGVDDDAVDSDNISSWVNTDLVSITEGHDQSASNGAGGGFAWAYGIDEIAGVVGNTTATADSTLGNVYITLALTPAIEVPTIKVNIDGVWKTLEGIKVNIDGVWKTVESVKVNIDGVWNTTL